MVEQLEILSRNLQKIAARRQLTIGSLARKSQTPIRQLELVWNGTEIPGAAMIERISNTAGGCIENEGSDGY